MKILYTSDLHGNNDYYKEIVQQARIEKIDTVIIGGDLLPNRGHSKDSLEVQKDFVKNNLFHFFIQLKEETGASVYLILGNDDWAATLPLFRELEESNLFYLLHDQTFNLTEDLFIIGYPYVPPTPFSPKDFEKRDRKGDPPRSSARTPAVSSSGQIQTIDEELFFTQRKSIQEDMANLPWPESHNRTILIMHSPPYDTTLDRLYDGTSVGSRAIRDFIEDQQPHLTLHGHIHESPTVSGTYWQKIGKTLSINPGQTSQRLSAVIFDANHPADTLIHTLHGFQNFSSPNDRANPS